MKCPAYIYTPSEYEVMLQEDIIVIVISASMMMWAFINMFFISKTKSNIYSVILTILFLFQCVTILGVCFNNPRYEDLSCSSEVSWFGVEEKGALPDTCKLMATVFLFVESVEYWILVTAVIELYLRVIMSIKDINYYRWWYWLGKIHN